MWSVQKWVSSTSLCFSFGRARWTVIRCVRQVGRESWTQPWRVYFRVVSTLANSISDSPTIISGLHQPPHETHHTHSSDGVLIAYSVCFSQWGGGVLLQYQTSDTGKPRGVRSFLQVLHSCELSQFLSTTTQDASYTTHNSGRVLICPSSSKWRELTETKPGTRPKVIIAHRICKKIKASPQTCRGGDIQRVLGQSNLDKKRMT